MWFFNAKNKNVKVNQYDKMTKTPVWKLVIMLGIPTTISMLVTNIYNMVDTMFVGKLGTSASGAVGIVFGFMSIIQAFGFMFGQGAGSIISRKLGAKNTEDASKVASTSFFTSFGFGLALALITLIFMNPMMYLLGSTRTILPYAKTYVFFIVLAAPFMTATFTMNNILRFEGKASLAMIGLMSGAILNIAGDPLFMFVFDLGIAGAGLSTALSQIVSFCILLSMFLLGKTQTKLSIKKYSKSIIDVYEIAATGFPSFVRQGLNSITTMILNNGAAYYGGDAAVSAMSIVGRISMFIFCIAIGVGQGFQPVCGFNYGAKKYSRVKKAFKFTYILCEIMLGVTAAVVLVLSDSLIGIFRNDPRVIEIGTVALKAAVFGLVLQPLCLMTNFLFQSSGKKLLATFVALLRSGLYFIPIFLIFSRVFGLRGIQFAQPVADFFAFITSIPFVWKYFKDLPKEFE